MTVINIHDVSKRPDTALSCNVVHQRTPDETFEEWARREGLDVWNAAGAP